MTSFSTEFDLDRYLSRIAADKGSELLTMTGGEVQPGDVLFIPAGSIIVEKAVGATPCLRNMHLCVNSNLLAGW